MYEVHFDRLAPSYPDYEPNIAAFDNPHDALAHAEQFLHPTFRTVAGFNLRIHDTSNGHWLTYAQLDFRLNGGMVPR